MVRKWLREADGSECCMLNKEREYQGKNLGEGRDSGPNRRSELVKSYQNPNLIPLGYGQMTLIKGIDKWKNMDARELSGVECGNGPMELQVDEENDPLHSMKGNHDISTSFTGQSSRMQ
ncbi:hypothetical protein GOBAR_AA34669 [Gossypium barbadense]|uniref:Uncharacterized protein n=1 Tax=Gossypium barbadense TaxID=3634 RepID=A0A2P5W4M0_GOSBA|nr:hypothetical protein GOBAR_AA34669 [Gossypium barbadense]